MRELGLVIMLLGATACASQPGRDGPATPTTSDTVRYPGEADDPWTSRLRGEAAPTRLAARAKDLESLPH
jgi:hypothetical protein